LLWGNTEKSWPRVYGHTIDVPARIVDPVFGQLEAAGATPGYIRQLRERFGI
jgi:hypothetical protein